MEGEIILLSSYGHAVFNEQGLLVEDALDSDADFPAEAHPVRLDVADFIKRFPGEPRCGEWDILDWSFWTQDGRRVEAEVPK